MVPHPFDTAGSCQFWYNLAMKPVLWVGSCLDDLRTFPDEVKSSMGFALRLAQAGGKHPSAKPLKGFGGAGVLEVVSDFDGSTYRAVYTVRLTHGIYALHAFQKKSTRGIKTSQHDIELIKQRLRAAEDEDRRRDAEQRGMP